nr:AAA family ATPase [Achromobacter ruhlandii]
MKINSFRIQCFRSIEDTEWVPFSQDNVTVLVGQNESGKSSILHALSATFSNESITEDDLRSNEPYPVMRFRINCRYSDIKNELEDVGSDVEHRALREIFDECGEKLEISFFWERGDEGRLECNRVITFPDIDEELARKLNRYRAEAEERNQGHERVEGENDKSIDKTSKASPPESVVLQGAEVGPQLPRRALMRQGDIAYAVYLAAPFFTLFKEFSGILPNEIAIKNGGLEKSAGNQAASNYLTVAGVNLSDLLKLDRRSRENTLRKANTKISEDFNNFWSQTIGQHKKVSLECQLEFYSNSNSELAGNPHLVFWINDGHTKLYPNQRSEGVRWFVSFFLQLKSAQITKKLSFFLLDEPGSNLHPRAQRDVLKLINHLCDEVPIIYSTHSPTLIEYEKSYRIHAVQRNHDGDSNPTQVIDAHRLGAASTDTLSPLLMAMGSDMASQTVVKDKRNVLVEEISGFYYFMAFLSLLGETRPAYFVAASGVNKIPTLASMFLAWGLDFITVVDDDSQGRGVYKEMKKDFYGDQEELATRKIIKLKGCNGIEDIFSRQDFHRHVLRSGAPPVEEANTEHLKRAGRSKPVLAFQFRLEVSAGRLKMSDFDAETVKNIRDVMGDIFHALDEES